MRSTETGKDFHQLRKKEILLYKINLFQVKQTAIITGVFFDLVTNFKETNRTRKTFPAKAVLVNDIILRDTTKRTTEINGF